MGEQPRLVEGEYFKWLYSQVSPTRNPNPSRSYYQLLEQLHRKPFTWFVPNDDNREEDGRELRYEYMNGPAGYDEYVSFLEMLIALSRRAAFESYSDTSEWFWHLMNNLDLRQYTDEVFMDREPFEIEYKLNMVLERTYDADGLGGLFPLHNSRQDQRKVELWYQMSSYLLEDLGP